MTKRLGIERPDPEGMTPDQMQYMTHLEIAALAGGVQEVKSGLDPRTWPLSTYMAIVGMVITAFAWAFNSGGEWRDLDRRIAAIESKQTQDSTIYARRDLLEQQMAYVVTGLNELKIKVDALTASSR